jgi:hypothetical protein
MGTGYQRPKGTTALHKLLAHRYDVANFGLKEEEIRESFGSYVDRYDLRSSIA